MYQFLLVLFFATFALAQDGQIGVEQTSGNLRVRTIKGQMEYSVFVRSTNCGTASVIVTMVFDDELPGQLRSHTETKAFSDCGDTPVRFVFKTNNRRVGEFRITETIAGERHSVKP